VPSDVARVDVDLDERRARPDVTVVELGGELGEARADGHDHVRSTARGGRLRRAGAPQRAEVQGMRVGHRVVSTVGRDHRDPVAIAQLNDELVRAGAARPAADDHERTLGLP